VIEFLKCLALSSYNYNQEKKSKDSKYWFINKQTNFACFFSQKVQTFWLDFCIKKW
jgi:hypothetical protein